MRHSLRSRARLIQRLVPALLVSASTAALGADAATRVTGEWPQWRGPGRDSSATSLQVPDELAGAAPGSVVGRGRPERRRPGRRGRQGLHLHPLRRPRGDDRARSRDRRRGLAGGLRGAVQAHGHGGHPRRRTLLDAAGRGRQALHARHRAGPDRSRRGHRQGALAARLRLRVQDHAALLRQLAVADPGRRQAGARGRRRGQRRGARGRSGHGQGRLAAAGRRPGVRLADRGRHRGHPADRHPHAEAL